MIKAPSPLMKVSWMTMFSLSSRVNAPWGTSYSMIRLQPSPFKSSM